MYFDDALIPAADFESLLHKLDIFLDSVQEVGMKLQLKKCNFGGRQCKWLGHSITDTGIFPDYDRFKVLLEWPDPTIRNIIPEP